MKWLLSSLDTLLRERDRRGSALKEQRCNLDFSHFCLASSAESRWVAERHQRRQPDCKKACKIQTWTQDDAWQEHMYSDHVCCSMNLADKPDSCAFESKRLPAALPPLQACLSAASVLCEGGIWRRITCLIRRRGEFCARVFVCVCVRVRALCAHMRERV